MHVHVKRHWVATASALVSALLILGSTAVAGKMNFKKTTYTFKKVGDLEIRADVHRADDTVIRPVVMAIHGGALIGGDRNWAGGRAKKILLEAGYAIVSIDYRLAPETKLPVLIKDVEDGYHWIRTQGPELFHVDTSRMVVMGGSAGGYLTLMLGFRVEPRPAALVSFWGYGDLVGSWYSQPSEFYRREPLVSKEDALAVVGGPPVVDGNKGPKSRGPFYLFCRQNGLWPKMVSGFDPHTEKEKFLPYEPVRNVSPEYAPTLLIHGTIDTDVPYEQSVLMAQQFEKHGVPHKFMTVEGSGHGLKNGDPQLVSNAYEEVLPFIKGYASGVDTAK
jgi:acetyl esterase/lipase